VAAYAEKVDTLDDRLKKIEDKLKTPTAPPAELPEKWVHKYQFYNYQVKENSTAQLYEHNLKVSAKGQKDGIIKDFVVRDLHGNLLFGPRDIQLGVRYPFDDKAGFSYEFVPTYVHRRRLANDFIGIAIRKFSTPTDKP
jgi:hypothetical protein